MNTSEQRHYCKRRTLWGVNEFWVTVVFVQTLNLISHLQQNKKHSNKLIIVERQVTVYHTVHTATSLLKNE